MPGVMVIMGRMGPAVRIYTNFAAMKADEYREWREWPAPERMTAVKEITLATYQMKEPAWDVRRLQRTLVHLPRPQR